ncbi:hypothetical protein A6R68_07712 [Neotoma lepida]|uniref:Cystatin domain-containing protein n=1 Tax=Neotoma lepida TaxID=56216 RepID=A0A1A6GD17_NEOLE|nr:hypothetical protein A6R68_07712 [Neotoma lepida]
MTSLQRPSLPVLAALLILAVSLVASTNAEAEQMTGGRVEPDDLKDKEVQKVVNFAVKTYNDMVNDLYFSRPIHVMSASKQKVTCNFEINTAAKLNKMSVASFNCYQA